MTTSTTESRTSAQAAVETVLAIATEAGRDDLVQRLAAAAARVRRPATIICVVGEFKQGKSSLINALLGLEVCPVDDDLATSATTLVRYGDEPRVDVRRRTDDGVVVENVDPATLAEWVSERGNPDNVRNVERVDISLPHPLLANGLALVDTPGMGGLGAGHAAATLAFLPFADGLVFVSDASAELSAPEAEFLERAAELCPNIAFALTKIDLYPAWRQIAAIDTGHLGDAARDSPVLPVASALVGTSGELDEGLADMSGVPALLAALDSRMIAPAKVVAAHRAHAEARGVLDQLGDQLRAELDVLENPSHLADTVARLKTAAAHLEQLRGPGARWSIVVADRVSDLSNSSNHQFRKAIRAVSRTIEDAIESLKTSEDWDQLARRLQTEVADAVTDVFVAIERGAQETRRVVVELIGDESDVGSTGRLRTTQVELDALWTGKGVDPVERRGGRQMSSALVGLRGAQSGIIMFGMLGSFLPSAAAALMMSNPITISIGATFAGVQLADAHKRRIAVRRQQARSNVRQFLDEVQFAVGNEINDAMRDVQRSIRDDFTERISELLRTCTETAQNAQRAAIEQAESAQQRIVGLRSTLERIDAAAIALAGSSGS